MKNMDMIHGPLLGRMVAYAIPLVFSGLLQLLFNAADIAVVGRFTGAGSLAAVSAASPVSALIVTLFMGLSTGTNVVCAQYAGAGREKDFSETLHTAVAISAGAGIGLMLLGLACADALLKAMDTPGEVLFLARRYLWIYFLGIPSMLLYNFGAAAIRAVGDTKKPLYFLTLSGILNVCLNLFFVVVFHMGVEGVAIATAISQTAAAGMVMLVLTRAEGMCHFRRKDLKIHREKLREMFRIGVPAGIQGAAFAVANLLIQSSVNSLGTAVMAASTIALNVDSFCFVAIDALGQAVISFSGQNWGAGNRKRVDRIFWYGLGLGCMLGIVIGGASILLAPEILGIYTRDPVVTERGMEIMFILSVFQFVNCTLNIPFHVLRSMGRSIFPLVTTIICVCGLRILWVYTVFRWHPTIVVLYMAWPATKGVASIAGILYYLWLRNGFLSDESVTP